MYKSIDLNKIKPRQPVLMHDKNIPRLPSDVRDKDRTPSPSHYNPVFVNES